jgi:hypothetical protein
MIKKRIILKYLISSFIILLTGCGGKTTLLPSETGQNVITEEPMYQELPDKNLWGVFLTAPAHRRKFLS